jgi:hypothetical protein
VGSAGTRDVGVTRDVVVDAGVTHTAYTHQRTHSRGSVSSHRRALDTGSHLNENARSTRRCLLADVCSSAVWL